MLIEINAKYRDHSHRFEEDEGIRNLGSQTEHGMNHQDFKRLQKFFVKKDVFVISHAWTKE